MNFFTLNFFRKMILIRGFSLFLLVFAFCGCQKKPQLSSSLTKEEQKDLDYLLRYVMIHGSGLFVLFGSKPLCDTGFFDSLVESGDGPYRRNLHDGWKAWEKLQATLPSPRRFLLIKEPVTHSFLWPEGKSQDQQLHRIILVDVQKTAFVLAENYEVFKKFTGSDFHPLEAAFEIEDPNSRFWNAIFNYKKKDSETRDHALAQIVAGLLFGFGKHNTLFWTWHQEFENKKGKVADYLKNAKFPGSIISEPTLSNKDLPLDSLFIPTYRTLEENEMTELYKKELRKIKKLYRGKDFLEVTLLQLSKT